MATVRDARFNKIGTRAPSVLGGAVPESSPVRVSARVTDYPWRPAALVALHGAASMKPPVR
jgi:hypothetical protein